MDSGDSAGGKKSWNPTFYPNKDEPHLDARPKFERWNCKANRGNCWKRSLQFGDSQKLLNKTFKTSTLEENSCIQYQN